MHHAFVQGLKLKRVNIFTNFVANIFTNFVAKFPNYSVYKENPEFPRNMLLSKNFQFLLNLYETWSK